MPPKEKSLTSLLPYRKTRTAQTDEFPARAGCRQTHPPAAINRSLLIASLIVMSVAISCTDKTSRPMERAAPADHAPAPDSHANPRHPVQFASQPDNSWVSRRLTERAIREAPRQRPFSRDNFPPRRPRQTEASKSIPAPSHTPDQMFGRSDFSAYALRSQQ